MFRKTPEVRRKGKDKAKEHYKKTGKYDGKATRRLVDFLEKTKEKNAVYSLNSSSASSGAVFFK